VKIGAVRPDALSHAGGEGQYIVVQGGFQLVDPRHVETGLAADVLIGLVRNLPGLSPGGADREFYGQPGFIAVLVVEEGAHFRARIALYHLLSAAAGPLPYRPYLYSAARRGCGIEALDVQATEPPPG
jgi:hypothetical protein